MLICDFSKSILTSLNARITTHFDLLLMSGTAITFYSQFENEVFFLANVRIDLPTSQGKGQPITRCFDY
jgi:hypothetical protein